MLRGVAVATWSGCGVSGLLRVDMVDRGFLAVIPKRARGVTFKLSKPMYKNKCLCISACQLYLEVFDKLVGC